jgi:hypothetical protein
VAGEAAAVGEEGAMTFWDFYGQHPVLGTIVMLVAAFLVFLAMVLIEVLWKWDRRK